MLVFIAFVCLLNNLAAAESETAMEGINRKFEEVFERLNYLEARNAQLEKDSLDKEREIQELKERISILEGNIDDPCEPKDAGQENDMRRYQEELREVHFQ